MNMDGIAVVKNHRIVTHEEWLAARKAFLAKEKELTRLRDEINEQRRALPWERVTNPYVFGTSSGKETLGQLFEGRSQLVVYHAMFHPHKATVRTPWTQDAACPLCSFWMDNFNGIAEHLNHRDVTIIAASRAPVEKLAAYRKRMGWTFKWVSSADTDFSADYGVAFTDDELTNKSGTYNYTRGGGFSLTELPGISVFYRSPSGEVFHTYSTYGRGLDMLNVAYHYLDIVPKGRDEGDANGARWVRRRGEYEDQRASAETR
jgi:predicted dithiol-disulfide oxidoreductase (DUF899 family)